jgi:hypothetical protein
MHEKKREWLPFFEAYYGKVFHGHRLDEPCECVHSAVEYALLAWRKGIVEMPLLVGVAAMLVMKQLMERTPKNAGIFSTAIWLLQEGLPLMPDVQTVATQLRKQFDTVDEGLCAAQLEDIWNRWDDMPLIREI